MATEPNRRNGIFQFLLIFAVVYLGSQLVLRTFFPAPGVEGGKLRLTASSVAEGNAPILTLRNETASGIYIIDRCPFPPADVFFVEPKPGSGEVLSSITSSQTVVPCRGTTSVTAGNSITVDLAAWKYSVFSRQGIYQANIAIFNQTGSVVGTGTIRGLMSPSGAKISPVETLSTRFVIKEPGFLTKIFRTFITKPFLNFLIFIASVLPNHSLGIAIIILTLAVKLLLLLPTQHALEGQRKMQMLQPKLDELKRLYPNDPKRQQEETMKLWKENKVNPFQACLPTLIQLPILIGLFYVIRDGSVLELSQHLIYPMYQHLDWRFNTAFLGLDLLKPEVIIFPISLVVLQFIQMKMAFSISESKRTKDAASKGKEAPPPSAMQTQQKVMLYILPLMIGFFALKFPAAVSLYWGISTVFGIAQQWYVNREHLRV